MGRVNVTLNQNVEIRASDHCCVVSRPNVLWKIALRLSLIESGFN